MGKTNTKKSILLDWIDDQILKWFVGHEINLIWKYFLFLMHSN